MAEISNLPITASQVRSIRVALARHGIDEETYRAMLARYGVATSKALTRRQASELLTTLGHPLPRPPGSGPAPTRRRRAAEAAQAGPRSGPRASGPVVPLATPLQRVFIEELRAAVRWREPDGYPRWLRHTMGMERVATKAQAARVIEGLKAMRDRGRVGE